MSGYEIRIFGDPVLKRVAEEVDDIDGALVDTCNKMLDAMYEAPGIGLEVDEQFLAAHPVIEGPAYV